MTPCRGYGQRHKGEHVTQSDITLMMRQELLLVTEGTQIQDQGRLRPARSGAFLGTHHIPETTGTLHVIDAGTTFEQRTSADDGLPAKNITEDEEADTANKDANASFDAALDQWSPTVESGS